MAAGVVRRLDDATPERATGDTAETFELIADPHYAEAMRLRVLRFSAGTSARRVDRAHDDLLFVTSGSGTLHAGGADQDLEAGVAAFVAVGESWSVTVGAGHQLELWGVLVPAPPGPAARAMAKPSGAARRAARLGAQERQEATSHRAYEVLFDASSGSGGATQFVGFIPPSGAPEHYHLYDELCVILRGQGVLHTQGTRQPIAAGSAFHIAPRLLHSVQNTGTGDLWILGVFRPEGSPSAAYYPDGTPAPGHDDAGLG
jgi:quercetin dioxygenase-like cupin family protein